MARIPIKSDVAGTVWKIERQAGQPIEAGEPMLIIEAMKMEIPVLAPASGTVAEIQVREQEAVAEGQLLGTLET